ncbi:MAG: homoserine dehydrogenase [Chloracidobacterium sp.]|uniref:Homoserine dehydrogenase n=1 Tax=Chloracidobacterium validum TaxID=2821543 RepID=A0ABX8B8K2_9BACT|nr:homoserine dehydrogenase [Chloracidobacterium validum]QUW03266.1 homoserine dehydrogenase [Chloracidobacterium validum]
METRILRCMLTGLGNIGRTFLEILPNRAALLRERYGVVLQFVAVADASGCITCAQGLDPAAIVACKRAKQGVIQLVGGDIQSSDTLAAIEQLAADVLFEATPTDIHTGQPGLDVIRAALQRGTHVVMASKGALVVAFDELARLSDWSGDRHAPRLRFSGAVAGALPSVNLGWRDLAGGEIATIEAVLNGTTQVMLTMMGEGKTYAEALAEAQRIGIAEPDPTLDVEGWDAANKLLILANAVLRQPTRLSDIAVEGITHVTPDDIHRARHAGGNLILLAKAERSTGGRYALSVRPTTVPASHPLARLGMQEAGIVYQSDIFGRTTAFSMEDGPVGTAAAMLRDLLSISPEITATAK